MTKTRVSEISLAAVLIVVVCTAVLFVHWPALSAQALSVDDDVYFTRNSLVRTPSWKSARMFLTEVFEPSTVGGYYQPLSMISLMIDYALGGQTGSLRPFHKTSLILHTANSALIIILLYELFGQIWIAAAVGLLFGVHPLTVETIPWVGERKTLLAAFFALWSLVLYIHFARRGNLKIFLGCVVMYMLALMSKPTATPLPVMMILMDYWPLKRLNRRTILEKLPLFVIAALSAVITYVSQSRTTSVITPQMYGPMRIPLVICHNIIFYLCKMIWPANLSLYPFPEPFGFSSPMVMAGVAGTCILIPLLIISLRWTPALLTGWLIYFVAIFPTIQIFQFGRVIASDKFVYLPSIGILMIVGAFLDWICGSGGIRRHKVKYTVVTIIILLLAGAESLVARQYLADWKDTISLFTRMVKAAPNTLVPLNHLGVAYFEKGDIEKAAECFTKSLKIRPDTSIYNNLAVILTLQGEVNEAVKWHEKAIQMDSGNAEAYYNIANILLSQGKFDEAVVEYEKALSINPKYLKSHTNLAVALMQSGRFDEAISHLQKAIELEPGNADIHYNLAIFLRQQGRLGEAVEHLIAAIKIGPSSVYAYYDLAMTLGRQGRIDEAIENFAKAAEIDPNNVEVRYGLACALVDKGRFQEAIEEYRQVLKLQPQDLDTRCIIGDVLAKQGLFDQAAAEYQEVLKVNPQHPAAQQGLRNIDDLRQSDRKKE
jgi:tetratricopeptide (TPR) repeat protein